MRKLQKTIYLSLIVWTIFLTIFVALFVQQTCFIIRDSVSKKTVDSVIFGNIVPKDSLCVQFHKNQIDSQSENQNLLVIQKCNDKATYSKFSNQRIALYFFSLLLNLIAILFFGYKLSKVQNSINKFEHRKIVRDLIIEKITNETVEAVDKDSEDVKRGKERKIQERAEWLKSMHKLIEKEISLLNSMDDYSSVLKNLLSDDTR
jgi:hypothetical protein